MTAASLAAWGAALGTFLLGAKELWRMWSDWRNRKHIAATEAAELVHQHALTDKVSVDAAALAVVTATGLLDAVKRELDDVKGELDDTRLELKTTREECARDMDRTREELRAVRQESERLVTQAREELAKLGHENAKLQLALNDCLGMTA